LGSAVVEMLRGISEGDLTVSVGKTKLRTPEIGGIVIKKLERGRNKRRRRTDKSQQRGEGWRGTKCRHGELWRGIGPGSSGGRIVKKLSNKGEDRPGFVNE